MTWLLRHRLTVRFRDCDPLGHVNNAVYLTYLEQARFTLWRAQVGYVAKDRDAQGRRGAGFILARAEIDFRAQARYGDELEVRVGLASIGRTSFVYEYEIADVATSRIVATAKTVQVWFDYDEGKPLPLPEGLKVNLAAVVRG
jgi:acyl-CoA thioester hydrolase